MSTLKTTNITHGSNSGTANLVLGSDGSVTFAGGSAVGTEKGRNLVINGAMNVAQRATTSTAGGYTVIADDVNSVYACDNITSVTSITLAGKAVNSVVESVTGNDTLTAADSGKTFVFADAAAVLTLPDSGGGDIIGWTAKFISNFQGTGQEVICTDTTNEVMLGGVVHVDTDDDTVTKGFAAEVADGFSSIEITGTTEGEPGSMWTLTNIAADRWIVEGVMQSAGTSATPFAAS